MIPWQFYFRLYPGSIKSPQLVEFLKVLQATISNSTRWPISVPTT